MHYTGFSFSTAITQTPSLFFPHLLNFPSLVCIICLQLPFTLILNLFDSSFHSFLPYKSLFIYLFIYLASLALSPSLPLPPSLSLPSSLSLSLSLSFSFCLSVCLCLSVSHCLSLTHFTHSFTLCFCWFYCLIFYCCCCC